MKAKMAGVTFLAALSCWPSATGRIRFVQLTSLSVSAEKSHPPYIAFAETERLRIHDEWDVMSRRPATALSTESLAPSVPVRAPTEDLAKNEIMRLPVMRIEKPSRQEMAVLQAAEEKRKADQEWIEQLPRDQKHRMEMAKLDTNVLEEDWSMPTWSEQARAILQQNQSKAAESSSAPEKESNGVILGAGLNPDGTVNQPERDRPQVVIADAGSNSLEVAGHVTLNGRDVAYYDPKQYFEIVRLDGGIEKDKGRIDIQEGSYNIRITGRSGEIVARLRDSNGRTIGEDRFKLARLMPEARGKVRGPDFKLSATNTVAGTIAPAYAMNDKSVRKVSPTVSLYGETVAANEGGFDFADVQKGSLAVLRAEAKNHAATIAMVSSGVKADLSIFPKSWVESMKQIVSEQRQMNLSDPEASIIWGKVLQDGKPRAGVTIDVESAPGMEAVYFNVAMIPDANLKATSENGLFAFIGTPEGFQSLVAKIGDNYYSHQNVVVERAAVSVVDLESTIRTEQIPLQVFDAFTGAPRPAQVLHQAVDHPLDVDGSGAARLQMPVLHRMSLVQVRPDLPYAPASYLISDDEGYVHLPLVRDDWVRAIQVWAKIDDLAGSAVVVGFVMDEDFTVEAFDPEHRVRTVYFDKFGNPNDAAVGPAGGGFVMFGLSREVQEIIVHGQRTGLLSSRVIPADSRTLSVLTFRSE